MESFVCSKKLLMKPQLFPKPPTGCRNQLVSIIWPNAGRHQRSHEIQEAPEGLGSGSGCGSFFAQQGALMGSSGNSDQLRTKTWYWGDEIIQLDPFFIFFPDLEQLLLNYYCSLNQAVHAVPDINLINLAAAHCYAATQSRWVQDPFERLWNLPDYVELNEEHKELLCTLCSAKAATVSAMYQHLHGERHRKKALTQKVEDVIWIKERNQLESLGLFWNHVLPSWWKKRHPLFYLGSVGGVASCFNLTEFNGIWACLVDGQPQMLVIFYIT